MWIRNQKKTPRVVAWQATSLWIFALHGLGCQSTAEEEPMDTSAFLMELAETHSDTLDAIKVELDFDMSSLYMQTEEYVEYEFWSGELEGEGVDGLEGITRVSGNGLYERSDDVFKWVTWSLEVEYQDLQVNGVSVSGESTFDVYEDIYEDFDEYHDLEGTLSWDGESHQVACSAKFKDRMQKLTATLDETCMEWETGNPEIP